MIEEYLDVPRQDIKDRRAVYEAQAKAVGGLLFIDKVPPKPVPVDDTRTEHEKYHIQMVNKFDKIVVYNGYRYEESCELVYAAFAESPYGDGPSRGYPTLKSYFESRVRAYETEIMAVGLVPADAPWRVVSGQVFVEP